VLRRQSGTKRAELTGGWREFSMSFMHTKRLTGNLKERVQIRDLRVGG
jgi:hypothetical protein